jgi:hypothetical protein
VVIDAWTSGALGVVESGQAELAVALAPDADLVVVQVDQLAGLPVGPAVGGKQDDPRSLGQPCLDGPGPAPRLEHGPITTAQFQWRWSHGPIQTTSICVIYAGMH